ncbi:MAG: tetratricopeptide repeat protein, partial [Candidatus Tectomicrobia bacterium]|nr:tetratricopeptide repeat protein [Candidatus Tectomicrobia bacterium]
GVDRVGATAQALGQWAEAEAAYRESLGLRRQQRERLGETPETVRDLSIALNRVGATAQALGQWEDARQLYQEALLLGRRLALAFPSHVEYQQTVKRLEDKLTELPTAPLSTSQASARDH